MMTLILLDLSIRDIIADIPFDAGTVVMLVIIGLFAGFIWHGSRSGSAVPPEDAAGDEGERPAPVAPETDG